MDFVNIGEVLYYTLYFTTADLKTGTSIQQLTIILGVIWWREVWSPQINYLHQEARNRGEKISMSVGPLHPYS